MRLLGAFIALLATSAALHTRPATSVALRVARGGANATACVAPDVKHDLIDGETGSLKERLFDVVDRILRFAKRVRRPRPRNDRARHHRNLSLIHI